MRSCARLERAATTESECNPPYSDAAQGSQGVGRWTSTAEPIAMAPTNASQGRWQASLAATARMRCDQVPAAVGSTATAARTPPAVTGRRDALLIWGGDR